MIQPYHKGLTLQTSLATNSSCPRQLLPQLHGNECVVKRSEYDVIGEMLENVLQVHSL